MAIDITAKEMRTCFGKSKFALIAKREKKAMSLIIIQKLVHI